LFISPMGEPFWGTARDDDPLADWFGQADRNHDGFLTMDEMAGDADRFFGSLDADHDGEIDPDEVTRYELVVAPQVRGEPSAMREVPHTGEDGGAGIDSSDADMGISGGGSDGPEGAGTFSLLNIPEPVAGADRNLDRSISRDEFRQTAVERFQLLDTGRTGRLTLTQLEAMRPSSPFAGFRHRGGHHRPKPSSGDSSSIAR
jgi:Ca2+-binding EF-hand superfamily protein